MNRKERIKLLEISAYKQKKKIKKLKNDIECLKDKLECYKNLSANSF